MTSRDFCYWCMGFFEIAKPDVMTAEQTDMVKRHLALVFKHEIDPSQGDAEHQAKLNEVHKPAAPLPAPGIGGGSAHHVTFRC